MNNFDNTILLKIDEFIEENLNDSSFSAIIICEKLGLSKSQLYRLIKEKSSLSIGLYIRKIKLEKAKYLLENTNLRISEIAYQVGIDSPQSFSKYFVESYTVSPSDYRKEITEQNYIKNIEIENIGNTNVLEEIEVAKISKNELKVNKKYLALTVFVLFSLAFLSWKYFKNESLKRTENAIAILPFKNLGAANTMYFTEGILSQIHSSLAAIKDIKLISKSSSSQYSNTKKSSSQIANDLKVDYLLEGSVLNMDDKIRINVELIKAIDNNVIWTNTYEGDIKDVFGFMATISKKIAIELQQQLTFDQLKKIDKLPTDNINAYNEFLQGQQLIKERTKEKIEAGILKFEKAIGLDPTFANAFAYKSICYFLLGDDASIEFNKSIKLSEKNALEAIKLDSENGTAYATLAKVYQAQYKLEQSNTTFQIALKYSPNDAQINYWYSLMLRSIGEFDQAIFYSSKAIELDPIYPIIMVGHIGNLAIAKKYTEANKILINTKTLFSGSFQYYWAVGFYYIYLKDFENALKNLKIAKGMDLKNQSTLSLIAFCEGKLGNKKAAEEFLKTIPDIPDNYRAKAIAYAGLEEREKCLEYLEKGIDVYNLPNYIKVTPILTFLHGEPRFEAILKKIGLADPKFIP